MEHFSTFDLIVALIILFLGLKGLLDGFVKEFFGLAGIIGGIYFGSRYAQNIGEWISNTIYPIKNEAALSFIGFLVGMFGIWIGMVLLGNLVTKLTHASGMGFMNKLLGVLFGWAKVFLILSVIIYAISSIEATKKIVQKYTKNSILYPLLVKTGGAIIKLKPDDFLAKNVKNQGQKAKEEISKDLQNSAIESVREKIKKTIDSNITKEEH